MGRILLRRLNVSCPVISEARNYWSSSSGKAIYRPAGLIIAALLFIALWPTVFAQAAPPSPEAVAEALSSRYRGMNSISAGYSRVARTPQTDKLFQSGSSQMAAGLLSWSRPASLLLDQKAPKPETMVTDGSTVWWYIPSESLAYRYRNLDVAGQLGPLLNFLSGLDSLKANFTISPATPAADRPGQTGLILKPKEQSGNVDSLAVWCDEAFNLTGFTLSAVTGESTDFHLSSLIENPQLDGKLFNFKPPRGVDIIDQE